MEEKKNKKVLLGMSGGVDSSVSAVLLKKAGYEVVGITMKLWQEEDNAKETQCCSIDAVYDAKRVCDLLEIPHYTLNLEKEFKEYVVDDFIECYKNAMTPNPCIECNKHIKFDLLYKKAKELGCDYIATGHYAKVEYIEEYNKYMLKKSNAKAKDQTYFLYSIPEEVVPYVIFPLAEYNDKSEIRKIANEVGLKIAEKPDSQEICFISNNSYGTFLNNHIRNIKKGNIVMKDGTVLGKHQGLIYYTIGQRKGLGISYKEPLYVIELDKSKNEVVVGVEKDLYSEELYANKIHLFIDIENSITVNAKVRYRAKEAEAIVTKIDEDIVKVEFKEKQRAITPGQSVVFYKDDIVIGGGKIIKKEL